MQLAASQQLNQNSINYVSATIMRSTNPNDMTGSAFYPLTTTNLATGSGTDVSYTGGTGYEYLQNSLYTWAIFLEGTDSNSVVNQLGGLYLNNLTITMNSIDQNMNVGDNYYAIRINLSGYSINTSGSNTNPGDGGTIYCGNVRLICLRVL